MRPINLPLALVLEKGRKAYLAGKLSAQGPTPACKYRDPSGRPCVIGAALPARIAHRFDDCETGSGLSYLVPEGLLATDDYNTLLSLQEAHDNWAQGISDAEDTLCALLGVEKRKAA